MLREILDDQCFYEVMQIYRHADDTEVVQKFKDVKDFIIEKESALRFLWKPREESGNYVGTSGT